MHGIFAAHQGHCCDVCVQGQVCRLADRPFDFGYIHPTGIGKVSSNHRKPSSKCMLEKDCEKNCFIPQENLLCFKSLSQVMPTQVYSCHSSEGSYNAFANRFVRAFRPVGGCMKLRFLAIGICKPDRPQANNS
jgi:hypothetical protein